MFSKNMNIVLVFIGVCLIITIVNANISYMPFPQKIEQK